MELLAAVVKLSDGGTKKYLGNGVVFLVSVTLKLAKVKLLNLICLNLPYPLQFIS